MTARGGKRAFVTAFALMVGILVIVLGARFSPAVEAGTYLGDSAAEKVNTAAFALQQGPSCPPEQPDNCVVPFPPEVEPIIQVLRVPPGLHLYLTTNMNTADFGGCPGSKVVANYNDELRRAELYRDWTQCYGGTREEMLGFVAHEVCHAHQHRLILDAGLPMGGPYDRLRHWVETPEGEAFMAAGGRSNLPTNPSVNPVEDFANICSAWYLRREYLREHDPKMYEFAAQWLQDSDADGIPEANDLCPGTASGARVDGNGCSLAQVDSNGDGVCDAGAPSTGPAPGCVRSPAVGGLVGLRPEADTGAQQSGASSLGDPAGPIAAAVGPVAAIVLLAAGWYAGRRWFR